MGHTKFSTLLLKENLTSMFWFYSFNFVIFGMQISLYNAIAYIHMKSRQVGTYLMTGSGEPPELEQASLSSRPSCAWA